MKTINTEQLVMIDVDETLVMWNSDKKEFPIVELTDPYDLTPVRVRAHLGHIKVLKTRKTRGAYIVVWSANGYKWAEAVVTALGLEEFVDICTTKPLMYIDDKEAVDVLGERLYLGADSNFGVSL